MTRTSRPIGTVIPARFPSLCRNCRHSYQSGDLIRKAADKVWVHDTCPNGEAAVAPKEKMAHELQLVRGIVRDELAGATLKVDEAEVLAVVARDVQGIVSRVYDSLAPKAEAVTKLVADAIEQTKAALLAAGVVTQQL